MIPEEGRDVQCSNCGHTWFELPGPSAAGEELTEDDAMASGLAGDDDFGFEDPAPEDILSSNAETDAEIPSDLNDKTEPSDDWSEVDSSDDGGFDADSGPDDETQDFLADAEADANDAADANDHDPDDDAETGDNTQEEDDDGDKFVAANAAIAAVAASRANEGGRRPADAADLDILREEAARELSQRRAPPSEAIETQADLGLESIRHRDTPSRALRARMAHLGDEADTDGSAEEATPKSKPSRSYDSDDGYEEPRRDLLPDIDEINSTLKPKSNAASEARFRSGFRVGFLLMLFLVVAAIFAYAQAPAIARALPDAEPSLISYVDRANALRDWLQGLFGNGP